MKRSIAQVSGSVSSQFTQAPGAREPVPAALAHQQSARQQSSPLSGARQSSGNLSPIRTASPAAALAVSALMRLANINPERQPANQPPVPVVDLTKTQEQRRAEAKARLSARKQKWHSAKLEESGLTAKLEKRALSAGFVNENGEADATAYGRHITEQTAKNAGFVTPTGEGDHAAYEMNRFKNIAIEKGFFDANGEPDPRAAMRYLREQTALNAGFKRKDGTGDLRAYGRHTAKQTAKNAGFKRKDGTGDVAAYRKNRKEQASAAQSPALTDFE
jgi:hypothetical protein